ncbi:carboxymethylenebutenolidase homolog [Papaver somniferum]|uniref:carboxymethylenebutenolidase homolog n=1 Tax=Papaver somniferum TaxID=3469 RepID=UPI000E6FBA03|nr:carboxymethylenebutenolidase homolog [Papaver somniferum]
MGLASTLSISVPTQGSISQLLFLSSRTNLSFSPFSSRRCSFSHKKCSYLTKNTTKFRVPCVQVKAEQELDDEACELVSGFELNLGEGTDSIRASLFKAVKNNNETGVLLLSDVFGFEDSATRDFAYRVACNGYNVLVPDLFRGNPWSKHRPKDDYENWRAKQSLERVSADINLAAKWMVDEFIAAKMSKKLGIIGFCFGGGRILETLSQDQGSYFGTGACFYGTRINPSVADSINVPVLFISGDKDPLCPVELLHDLEKNIGRGSKVVVFEGRGHGFVHRPESQEEDEDADAAFSILRNWLHDGLVVKKE